MQVLLTGGTGFIGTEVLRALRAAGHDVTAVVRSDASAASVTAAGATALRGDLTDVDWLTTQLRRRDGAIHAASPSDATSADFDRAVVAAVLAAFAGTGKAYVHTGGIWAWGSNDAITEKSPFRAPELTAWREAVEQHALSGEGMRATVVAPGIVYGNGKGLPNLVTGAPRTDDGELVLVGDGSQHWTTVHVADVADLYVRALERAEHGAYYIGVGGDNPTVRELGEAAAAAAGAPGVHAETAEETRARLGEAFADALLLDQQATGAKARADLGWDPSQPSLLEDIATGSYAPVTA